MSVDYRLLHHFRVSQRRELAARGELPVKAAAAKAPDADATPAAARTPTPARPARPKAKRSSPAHVQVLTHLLNEDR